MFRKQQYLRRETRKRHRQELYEKTKSENKGVPDVDNSGQMEDVEEAFASKVLQEVSDAENKAEQVSAAEDRSARALTAHCLG